jgi:hypothetical protein
MSADTDLDKGPYYFVGEPYTEERKHWYWDEAKGEIHFQTRSQLAIWVRECLGQISDGVFENSDCDFGFWYDLRPIVDGTLGWKRYDDVVPQGMWPTDLSEVREYVGERMLEYGRAEALDPDDYDEDAFDQDCEAIERSVGTSLRKIGYLD